MHKYATCRRLAVASCHATAWLEHTDTFTVDTRLVWRKTASVHVCVYDPISPGGEILGVCVQGSGSRGPAVASLHSSQTYCNSSAKTVMPVTHTQHTVSIDYKAEKKTTLLAVVETVTCL